MPKSKARRAAVIDIDLNVPRAGVEQQLAAKYREMARICREGNWEMTASLFEAEANWFENEAVDVCVLRPLVGICGAV